MYYFPLEENDRRQRFFNPSPSKKKLGAMNKPGHFVLKLFQRSFASMHRITVFISLVRKDT